MRFSPVRGVDLIPDTVCKSRWCRQILSRLRADLRENPIKQWASRDALIQSAGSISDSARYHSDANIALGPILKMYIPGQIRIFNALNSDGYSTGNAPPSGNNGWYISDIRNQSIQKDEEYAYKCIFLSFVHNVSTLGPGPIGQYFADDAFKCILS